MCAGIDIGRSLGLTIIFFINYLASMVILWFHNTASLRHHSKIRSKENRVYFFKYISLNVHKCFLISTWLSKYDSEFYYFHGTIAHPKRKKGNKPVKALLQFRLFSHLYQIGHVYSDALSESDVEINTRGLFRHWFPSMINQQQKSSFLYYFR